jgi:hypothetical protein
MILPGVIASSGGVASSYESIATTTLTTSTASVTFSSIPSTFTHLQVRSIQRATAGAGNYGDESALIFNGDTGNNYARHNLYGEGTTAGAGGTASNAQISVAVCPRASVTANCFGVGVLEILDYKNTNKYKTARSLTAWDANGSGVVIFESGVWMNTAAITSITLTAYNTAFAQYSSFALYGVKA